MISPSEADVLAQLRKTTLAYLSNADFAQVEKAVERDGILSLQGSVATLVKDAVRKHGAHDQSSHNPKKGGGGAGSGGGSGGTRPRENPFTGEPSDNPNAVNPFTGKTSAQDISDAKEDVANRIKGAESTLGRNRPSSLRPQDAQAEQRVEGTIKGYKDAGALIGKPNELSKLKSEMVRAKKDIRTPSYYMRPDNAFVDGYADAVIDLQRAYGNLKEEGYRFADVKSPAFPMGTYGESFGD